MDVVDRYLDMESILEDINQSFIALPSDEVADNNLVLHEILMTIINLMKDSDDLFAELFEKLFYGGSYWDGVKVTRPDEYDVHVQCNLQYDAALKPSDVPGWVTLQFHDMGERRYRNRFEPYYGIDGLHILINEDDYLDTEKVMVWFHQTLSVALGGTKKGKQRQTVLQTRHGTFNLSFERHGPAFTFYINGWVNGNEVEMNLDFVPSFVFEKWQYPKRGFRQNRTSKGETFIVAKPLNTNVGTRYWRLSFQNQERELIKNRVHFKPALRLLKKMRDRLGHECIASYFIKNLMLLELDKRDDDFWNNPLSYVFMEMLKDYQRAIRNGVIEFYWYKKDNLISNIPYEDLEEISKELSRIIKTINRSPGNDSIAKFFLTKSEYKEFMRM